MRLLLALMLAAFLPLALPALARADDDSAGDDDSAADDDASGSPYEPGVPLGERVLGGGYAGCALGGSARPALGLALAAGAAAGAAVLGRRALRRGSR
jgi:hypothetical protein